MRDLKNKKNEAVDGQDKEGPAARKVRSVLEAFECIVEMAEKSCFGKDFFDKTATVARYASRKMKLTPIQTILLALFVDRSEDNSIRLSEIADYVGCRTTKMLRFSKEIDALESKHYLVGSRSHGMLSYRVPYDVIEAVKAGRPYVHENIPITDLQSFFYAFNELVDRKNNDELTHDRMRDLTIEYLEMISNSRYARTLNGIGLDGDYTLLFTYMAHLFIENDDDYIMDHNIDDIFDNNRIPFWCKRGFATRSNVLFHNKLIENAGKDGIMQPDAFKLTDYAKTELLDELDLAKRSISDKDLIKHEELTPKTLIYNTKENEQIAQLASILAEDRFNDVQQRLEKAGMRKGFCCLFYGAPGTGKTETVYQLARRTGRDILRVDVDKIKSCWVGESEKNIKALFDRYRNLCRNSARTPILLFNEADAVLGIRIEGAARAVDKMENSIQNIILQEMESLEGIMIATTNLTTNLDKAFERRFLYKIRYEKPTVAARAQIWKAMMPALSDIDAATLAAESDLSGGEIENIVRKQSVAAILSGRDTADICALRELCKSERIAVSHKRIGF